MRFKTTLRMKILNIKINFIACEFHDDDGGSWREMRLLVEIIL